MTTPTYTRLIILILLALLGACDGSDNDGSDDALVPGPDITVTTPGNDFLKGKTWDGFGASPVDNILTFVSGEVMTNNDPPTVVVNGETATEVSLIDNNLYKFDIWVPLSKGPQTITVVGANSLGGSTTVKINGVADYCIRGYQESGVSAEYDAGQNNRCHEIDGCNRNQFGAKGSPDTISLRNQPMPKAIYGLNGPVEFGSGYLKQDGQAYNKNNDAFIHGLSPAEPLGCNIHDTCYQTCVPSGDREVAWRACNNEQYANHIKECDRVYPAACPWTDLGKRACRKWQREKKRCKRIANKYYSGVNSFIGRNVYDKRQDDYCINL